MVGQRNVVDPGKGLDGIDLGKVLEQGLRGRSTNQIVDLGLEGRLESSLFGVATDTIEVQSVALGLAV